MEATIKLNRDVKLLNVKYGKTLSLSFGMNVIIIIIIFIFWLTSILELCEQSKAQRYQLLEKW